MDTSTIRAGPLRRLRDRANVCDYSPTTYRSRVVIGISDLETPLVGLIQYNQKPAHVGKHSAGDESAAIAITTQVPPKATTVGSQILPQATTVGSQRTRTPDGVYRRNIVGTGCAYARTLRQQESFPDDGPPDPAGPLQPGLTVTLSNTLGNIIVYRCKEAVKVWVLRYSSEGAPTWVEAKEGDPHPEADSLRGYSLSLKNPKKPSWVKSETLQQYQSKDKRRAG